MWSPLTSSRSICKVHWKKLKWHWLKMPWLSTTTGSRLHLQNKPGDKVYLNASNIQTNQPSRKLSHCRLGPFPIVKKVGNGAYRLRLPASTKRLHPVFNTVKLTPAPSNPIKGHYPLPPLPPKIIDGEEEWIVEEILDSKMIN
jgi:hypothetical protein